MLRDQLGAELVETTTPKYPDDPSVPNLDLHRSRTRLSELLPRLMPEILTRKDEDGKLFFDVPGYDVTSYDYLMKLSNREAPLTSKVDITNFASLRAHSVRAPTCAPTRCSTWTATWLARGDTRITNWTAWVANAKFRRMSSRAGAQNWVLFTDHFDAGKAERLARSHVARMALARVMLENRIDAFVHAENTVPTPKIQGRTSARAASTASRRSSRSRRQAAVLLVRCGRRLANPAYALNADEDHYEPGSSSVMRRGPRLALI